MKDLDNGASRPGPDSPYYVPPTSSRPLWALYLTLAIWFAWTLALLAGLILAIVKGSWVVALFLAVLLSGVLWLRSKTVPPMLRDLHRRRAGRAAN